MNGNGADYDEIYPTIMIDKVIETLDKYLPLMNWSDEDVLLDIGCGPGRTTKNILLAKCPKVGKIVGVDIVPQILDYARIRHSHRKIEFKRQNIVEKIEPEDVEKYDKIFSFYALHFFSDFDKLFSAVSTLMKPGGYFFFHFITKSSQFLVRREMSTREEWIKHVKPEDMKATIPPTMDWEDTEGTFRKTLSRFHLNVIDCKCEMVDVMFPTRESFLKLQRTVIPKIFFENMSGETKELLWKETGRLLFKYGDREENGEVVNPLEMLSAFGQKTEN